MISRRVLILCGACSLGLLACRARDAADSHDKAKVPADPADAVYEVRGRVESLETQGADTTIQIAHEAMPTFKDRDGNPSAMPAMTMPFSLDPRVDRKALPAKSLHNFTLEIHWSRAPGMRVVAASPLSPDTKLDLAAQ